MTPHVILTTLVFSLSSLSPLISILSLWRESSGTRAPTGGRGAAREGPTMVFLLFYLLPCLFFSNFYVESVAWPNSVLVIRRNKVRLITKGYMQQQGVDIDEVFAPVTGMELVRMILPVAAHEDWRVQHIDVKSAFLNGELQEEVYVQRSPPPLPPASGFMFEKPGQVLRLKKAL